MEETGQRNCVKEQRYKHTNVVKHELISFFSLFLTLQALLIIYFPDKSDITAPAMPITLAYTKLQKRKNKLSKEWKTFKATQLTKMIIRTLEIISCSNCPTHLLAVTGDGL